MNRRDLLKSIFVSTALAACPAAIESAIALAPQADWKSWIDQWISDATGVLAQCWEDQILYGVSAHEQTKVYPFIRRVDPTTLPRPATTGGLFG